MTHPLRIWGPVSWMVEPITIDQHKRAMIDRARALGFDSTDDLLHFQHQSNLAADGDDDAARALRYVNRALTHIQRKKQRREQAQDMGEQRWGNETEVIRGIVIAILAEDPKTYPSKKEAAKRIADRVNARLTEQGIKARSWRTLEKYIP